MKKTWAGGYCFGGTMIWRFDFDTGNGRSVLIDVNENFEEKQVG